MARFQSNAGTLCASTPDFTFFGQQGVLNAFHRSTSNPTATHSPVDAINAFPREARHLISGPEVRM
ncbi:MAG TPA: hypothetical protein VF898_06630 [Chloroflexota bacterium]